MLRLPFSSGPYAIASAVAVALVAIGGLTARGVSAPSPEPLVESLPGIWARPVNVDTLFLGGYARGSFAEALPVLASELSGTERAMIGRHLDRIFLSLLPQGGLGSGGRLRVAYERVTRPDGSTRSIRVLAAEAAAGGKMHTAFLFERSTRPGYYDRLGRALEPSAWAQPLDVLRITSPFGRTRMHPILQRILPHTGVDLRAAHGTPVRSTGDGSVIFAGSRGGYGMMVEILHPNGFTTRYAHLSRISVRPHQVVSRGETLGNVGATGLATGPHLHYEVRRLGRPIDPTSVSGAGPGEEVGFDPAWRTERTALGSLLARAPSVVSVAGRGVN